MKRQFKKWVRWLFCFGLACVVLVTAFVGCASLGQRKTEARIRHYFALDSREPLTDSAIKSALLSHFPIGTPINKLQTWLAGQGLGVDGHSMTWQTNQTIGYQVYDYSDGFISMRHIAVWVSFDGQQKIQNIQAQAYSYGL